MTASILSAGIPKLNSRTDRYKHELEHRMFLRASAVVATPSIKIIGIFTIHSLSRARLSCLLNSQNQDLQKHMK